MSIMCKGANKIFLFFSSALVKHNNNDDSDAEHDRTI